MEPKGRGACCSTRAASLALAFFAALSRDLHGLMYSVERLSALRRAQHRQVQQHVLIVEYIPFQSVSPRVEGAGAAAAALGAGCGVLASSYGNDDIYAVTKGPKSYAVLREMGWHIVSTKSH